MQRSRLPLAFAALGSWLIALGSGLAAPPPAAAQKPLVVRLGVHTQLMGAPDVIAIRQGYFKQEGLDVQWRRFALGKEGRDAMIAGQIDINNTAPTPFLVGLDKGVPYVAIGVNSYFCGTNHVVVAKASDITSVAQLKGRKVGLPKGTITEFVFLTKVLPAYGLKPGDVQVANIPDAKDRIPSLVARAVDAVALADPFVAIGEHEGIIRSLEDFCRYDVMPFMTTATIRIVQEQPQAVVAYLRGWLRAVRLLTEEPERAAAVYLDDLKSLGREVPLPVIDRALRRMKWEPEITPAMERYLTEMAREMVAAPAGSGDRIRAVPDLGKALNKELLRQALAAR